MTDATLYQNRVLSRLRLWPPRPSARSAVVLERRGGYRLITRDAPVDPLGFISGRFRQVFRVELAPLQVDHDHYELPSRELARPFRADLKLTVQVIEPVRVVKEQKTSAWEAIEPVLRLPLRQIGRRYAPEQVAEVEEALHEYLTDRRVPQAGLRVVRAGVTVNLEGPDLKRAREKIEDRHRRELDELNTRFRVQLEKEEAEHGRELEKLQAEHRRELEETREKHHRALETQRRELYEEVMGEGLLPKLLLIKLGARPAGGDQKDLDEVIEIVTQLRVDNFKIPLELLAQYIDVMERWQLEEPVTTLLKHLVDTFGPQAFASQQDDHVIGEETEVKRVDPDPEDSKDEDSKDEGEAENKNE
jgi:hypothetical protein